MNRLVKVLFALAIACGLSSTPASTDEKGLTVFAAASMKNALDEVDAAYTAKTGVKVNASYAASSTLARQIDQGAPADIFVSADTDWMDYAINKKTINVPTRVDLGVFQTFPTVVGTDDARRAVWVHADTYDDLCANLATRFGGQVFNAHRAMLADALTDRDGPTQ